MNLNLTCSKTHILAWINSDQTLSLKLNGVKYLAFPKVDKRGEKYWKVDSAPATATFTNSSLTKKELGLVKSYQEKVANNYKMPDFSKAEVDAYCKWEEEQAAQKKLQATIESRSQLETKALLEKLKEKQEGLKVSNHEPVNQSS